MSERQRRSRFRGLAAAVVAAALWLGAGAPEGAAQQPPAVVSVDQVRMEAMTQTVPVIGRLVARRAGEVAARTAGPVAQLHVAVGDRVETGDPIAELDTVRLRAERNRLAAIVNEAQAQVERLTAQSALHRQELRRFEGLRESAAFSQSRFEDARQQVIIAESAIGTADAARLSASASLRLAEIDLEWATVTAPYPGVITLVYTEVGAWLGVGEGVVAMVNEDARQQVIIAESAIGTADAARLSASASLRLAEIDLEWATVTAPYPGVITLVYTEVGAWLGVGEGVVAMVNDQDLEVEADVPSSRIEALQVGAQVSVVLDDGTEHTAIVRTVVPKENALTRTRQVRFTPRFSTLRKPLAINQSATVELPTGDGRDVLTVHKDAIVRRQGQAFVYVAKDGQAQIRPVQLGVAVGGRFEVMGGVGPGEPVVVRGNERLRPGQAITVGGAG